MKSQRVAVLGFIIVLSFPLARSGYWCSVGWKSDTVKAIDDCHLLEDIMIIFLDSLVGNVASTK